MQLAAPTRNWMTVSSHLAQSGPGNRGTSTAAGRNRRQVDVLTWHNVCCANAVMLICIPVRCWMLRCLSRDAKCWPCRSILSVELCFHVVALAWYLRVWLWHFTEQAAQLPGAKGFGWFTRYLTFYSFSLQLLQLILCCGSKLLPVRTL